MFSGRSSRNALNKDTNEELATLDFTEFREPGRYVIEIEGYGTSPEIVIASNVFNHAFYTATRAMYLSRVVGSRSPASTTARPTPTRPVIWKMRTPTSSARRMLSEMPLVAGMTLATTTSTL